MSRARAMNGVFGGLLTAALALAAVACAAPAKVLPELMAAPGVRLLRLTTSAGLWNAPLPSPDGRWVAVQRADATDLQSGPLETDPHGPLWLFSTSGDAARPLSESTVSNCAGWSPDSRRLVWDSTDASPNGRNALWMVTVNGKEAPAFPSGDRSEFCPSCSPVRREFAFYSTRVEPLGIWRGSPGRAPVLVSRFPDHAASDWMPDAPAWSPDGNWLAVERDSDRPSKRGLIRRVWVYSRDGRRGYPHGPMSEHVTSPAWQTDTPQLATVRDFRTVYVAEVSGEHPRRLWVAPRKTEIGALAWQPHGASLLAFCAPEGRTVGEIWRINGRSGEATRLVHGGLIGRPAWSPDGRSFYFVRSTFSGSEVWRAVL